MSNVKWGKGAWGMMKYLRKERAGQYRLQWHDSVVYVLALKQGGYNWVVQVDGHTRFYAKKFNDAVNWIDRVWGNEPVMTRNLLNPAAGEFPIARKQYGGCCDPGTETYHCM